MEYLWASDYIYSIESRVFHLAIESQKSAGANGLIHHLWHLPPLTEGEKIRLNGHS